MATRLAPFFELLHSSSDHAALLVHHSKINEASSTTSRVAASNSCSPPRSPLRTLEQVTLTAILSLEVREAARNTTDDRSHSVPDDSPKRLDQRHGSAIELRTLRDQDAGLRRAPRAEQLEYGISPLIAWGDMRRESHVERRVVGELVAYLGAQPIVIQRFEPSLASILDHEGADRRSLMIARIHHSSYSASRSLPRPSSGITWTHSLPRAQPPVPHPPP